MGTKSKSTSARREVAQLNVYLSAMITAQGRRFDDLRASDALLAQQLREAGKTALDAALTNAEKAVIAALSAVDKATKAALDSASSFSDKTDASMEKRLELLNELRKGVATIEQLEMTRAGVRGCESRLDKMEAALTARSGGLRDYIGWIVALVTVVSAVALWAR